VIGTVAAPPITGGAAWRAHGCERATPRAGLHLPLLPALVVRAAAWHASADAWSHRLPPSSRRPDRARALSGR
jgi:hypothetical protein